MQKIALLKILQQLNLEVVTAKPDQRSRSKSNAGFTLLEIVFVVFIIGILGAIAAPRWVTFANQRRVNAVNDAVVRALQEAQQEAKMKKIRYSVSFKTENNVPKVAFHLATNTTPTNWQNLGKGLEIKPGQVLLGTNLSGENTAGSSLSYASSTAQKITFDHMGNLPLGATVGSKGLIVAVAVPKPGNSTQALDATRRCVKVKTLLGAIQTGKKDECNA